MKKENLKLSEKLLEMLNIDYERIIKELKVSNLEMSNNLNNIYRKVNTSMSNCCENRIAILVSEILKKRKYKYIIDTYLTYYNEENKKNSSYRPDILVIENNVIVGIIEVKSQMGYCGDLNSEENNTILNSLIKNGASIKYTEEDIQNEENDKECQKFWSSFEKVSINKNEKLINFKFSKKTHIFVVNILSKNHVINVEKTIHTFDKNKYKNIHFYTLYNEDIWYTDLKKENACKIYETSKRYKEVNDKTKNDTFIINNNTRKKHGFEKFISDLNKYL